MLIVISFLFLLVIGSITGFLTGFFGVGGGIILVPALMLLFDSYGFGDIAAHMAVGTSLALIIPNSLRAVRKEVELGNYDTHFLRRFRHCIVIGMFSGGFLMFFISDTAISIIFFVGLGVSLVVLLMRSLVCNFTMQNTHTLCIGSTAIGALSVLMGVGGGTLTVPFFHKVLGFPLKQAIAISNNFSIYIAIRGTLVAIIVGLIAHVNFFPYTVGYVNTIVFVIVALVGYISVPLGVGTSNQVSVNTHKWLFVILIVLCMLLIIIRWAVGKQFYNF